MAQTGVRLNLEFFWNEEQTDCSDCAFCDEMIVSKMYVAYGSLSLPDDDFLKFNVIDTGIKICNNCKEEI